MLRLVPALLIYLTLSCSPRPIRLPNTPSFEAGFQVFPSPRTFDPPGTIIRIDPSGVRYAVADLSGLLKITPREEAIPRLLVYGEFDVGAFFSWLGAPSGSAGFNRIDSAVVEVDGARREQTFDVDLARVEDSARSLLDWRKPGRYFLIRETILADSVVIILSRSVRVATGASFATDSAAKRGVSVSWSPRAATRIGLKFRQPHRVFYKLDLLTRVSRLENDTASALVRIPVGGTVRWSSEASTPEA